MNTLVSLPIVAAMPTTAPAMPSTDSELVELANQYMKVQERWSALADEEAELTLVQYAGRYSGFRKSAAFRRIRRECKKLVTEMRSLEQRIVALRATTIHGMQAKVRCVKAFHYGALEIEEDEASGLSWKISIPKRSQPDVHASIRVRSNWGVS